MWGNDGVNVAHPDSIQFGQSSMKRFPWDRNPLPLGPPQDDAAYAIDSI